MKPHFQCAEQQVSRSNLTKYCACHAERLTYLVFITYETSFTMRGAIAVTIQPHQILRLSRKIALRNFWQNLWKQMKRHFQCGDDPRMIRPWSENDPRMIRPWKRKPQPASQVRLLFELPRTIFYCKIQRFEPNLTFKHSPSAAPATKSNTWPSPNTAPTTKSNTWTSPNTAPTTKSNTWTSPSTAPATKSDTHSSSSWHMKPHLQCAEQPMSPSKLTKYCACHAKWPLNVWQKFAENRWNVISNAGTIREWSEHDPRMIRPWSDHENANRNPPRKWGYFSSSPGPFSIVKYNVSSPILHSNIHQVLRLPQKVTLDLHGILPLPQKVTLELHQILPLPRKVTLDLHQVLRLSQKVPLDLHRILPLPRKVTRIVHPRDIWTFIYNARSNQCLPPNSPNTAPATQNDHLTCGRNLPKTGETSFPMRGRSENDPSMIREWSDHENANRNPPRKWGYFSSSPGPFSIVKYNVSSPILHSNIHQVLRLPQKVTLDLHRILPLPRKVTLDLHGILPLPQK